MPHPPLILASTSPFRRALLERLGISFATAMPNVDETMQPDEAPRDMVLRLAKAKARSVAPSHPSALVIGSDQVACIDGIVLGKPGDRLRAIEQLTHSSGREVVFYTGLCLLNTFTRRAQTHCEPFRVDFRTLTREQIEGYVDREKPFNCAGSFRSEGLGIALFKRMQGDDPNALVGLPLIVLTRMLESEGVDLLAPVGS